MKGDLTWEDVKVLSVWDSATASNFGHIVLQPLVPAPPLSSGGSSTLSAPDYSALGPTSQVAPAPSYSNFLPPALPKVGELQPTMFDNCLTLAPSFRMRWTLGFVPGTVDIGLEYALTKTQYMAFGWAKPGNIERHMLDADVVVTGIDDKVIVFKQVCIYSLFYCRFVLFDAFLSVWSERNLSITLILTLIKVYSETYLYQSN